MFRHLKLMAGTMLKVVEGVAKAFNSFAVFFCASCKAFLLTEKKSPAKGVVEGDPVAPQGDLEASGVPGDVWEAFEAPTYLREKIALPAA